MLSLDSSEPEVTSVLTCWSLILPHSGGIDGVRPDCELDLAGHLRPIV